MNSEQLHEFIRWINVQIEHSNQVIQEARVKSNFGREAQYEGMRDAYLQLLRRLKYQEVTFKNGK